MSRVLKDSKNQITNGYSNSHKAVDVVKYKNKTAYVIAHTEGIVVWLQKGQINNKNATGNASYGNCVKLKHPNGYYTLYAHLKTVDVKLNENVKQGQIIGYMGETGRAFNAHLHFEVRDINDRRINPTKYLNENLPHCNYYQAYDYSKKKWLPLVKIGSNDYAGNIGNKLSGITIDNLTYRVHDIKKKKWLPYVNGMEDYAGNLSNPIDGIQIKGATYRVHILGYKWLPWVCKVDNSSNGYAGIYGKEIDAIQIK